MKKIALLLASVFLLASMAFASHAVPDSNILGVSSPGDGNYFKASVSRKISFTVRAHDVNGYLAGSLFDLNAKLYYSATKGAFTSFIADINLMNTAYCSDNDFSSADRACNYDWLTPPSFTDGNYFLDFNLYVINRITRDTIDANATESSKKFNLDATKPSTAADYNSVWQKTDANVKLACGDANSGCQSTSYRRDTDSGSGVSFGAWLGYDGNIFFSQDGNFAIDFNSTDRAGNVGDTNTIHVLIDKSPPSISTDVNAGVWQRFDANAKITASDSVGELLEVWVIKNGVPQQFTSGFSGVNALFNTDGNHALDANAKDKAGNSFVLARQHVLIDKSAPNSPSVSVSAGNAQLTASWGSVADNGGPASGIKHYLVYLDNSLAATTTSTAHTIGGLSNNQSYTVKVAAVDNANNDANSAGVTGTPAAPAGPVDSIGPVVGLVEPKNNAIVSGVVKMKATASDASGIERVSFFIKGSQLGSILQQTDGFYVLDLNTIRHANGKHELWAIGLDKAGNSSTSIVSVTIENIKAVAEQQSPVEQEAQENDAGQQATVGGNETQPTGLFSLANAVGESAPIILAIIVILVVLALKGGGGFGFGGESDFDGFGETGLRRSGRWAYRKP